MTDTTFINCKDPMDIDEADDDDELLLENKYKFQISIYSVASSTHVYSFVF